MGSQLGFVEEGIAVLTVGKEVGEIVGRQDSGFKEGRLDGYTITLFVGALDGEEVGFVMEFTLGLKLGVEVGSTKVGLKVGVGRDGVLVGNSEVSWLVLIAVGNVS